MLKLPKRGVETRILVEGISRMSLVEGKYQMLWLGCLGERRVY